MSPSPDRTPQADEPPIRRAASAICAREGAAGEPEVLLVRRSLQSRFLPGYVAFPGGAVDEADDAHAERWFADSAQAYRAAAVRELAEEVGLYLTADGLRAGSLADVDDRPPAPEQLCDLCHWIAPPDVPVRFDARYFTVQAPGGLEPVPDGHETIEAWWASPRALLLGWEEGARKLYWPTWYTVTQLATCASAAQLAAFTFETRDPTPEEEATLPRHVMENEP